jgi:DNA-binding LacI/PurR family transcriptional regulator
MAVTIYDVAKEAGVGIGTVSRAINNSSRIRPETKQRVLEVVQRLGYSPHAMAQRLARRRTGILAAIMPFYTGHFYQELLRGIQRTLFRHEYDLIIYHAESTNNIEAFLDNCLQEKRCDGVLVISMDIPEAYVEKFANSKLPIVLVDRANEDLDSIQVENEEGALIATKHLLSLGHLRIAMISGHEEAEPAKQRRIGYEKALKKAGLAFNPGFHVSADMLNNNDEICLNDGFNETVGYAAMERLLKMGEDRPTAVFASADIQAVGAIRAAEAAGLRVPEDIAIIGFDGIELAAYLSLTTMQQPMYEMGRLAIVRIMHKIESKDTDVKHIRLSTQLIERGTTTRRYVHSHVV